MKSIPAANFGLLIIPIFIALICCNKKDQGELEGKIYLPDIHPVGIAFYEDTLLISDPDHNRVLHIDLNGSIVKKWDNLERPMHIAMDEGKIYVPEFFSDTIKVIEQEKISFLPMETVPDAPSGISVSGDTIAIADFYNHRIIFQKGNSTITFGSEGHEPGKLYYPTDVKIYHDDIIVADAYNNRVQVFDKEGNYLKVIGDEDNIKVATGIAVYKNQLYVTDFEGNRILIYDLEGDFLHSFTNYFNKPTDIDFYNHKMYVANYGENSISVFKLPQ